MSVQVSAYGNKHLATLQCYHVLCIDKVGQLTYTDSELPCLHMLVPTKDWIHSFPVAQGA